MSTAPRVAAPDLRAGSVIAGRYRVISTIGRGGMGTVLLAEHLGIGRKVAVKVLSAAWVLHDEARQRFIAEARMTARIAHPGVVTVVDAGELADGRPFLAMEYLHGVSLLTAVRKCGPFPIERALEIARDIADALVTAHAVGIVHRDLKSDNVMLVAGPDGRKHVKVLDFGIAAALHAAPSERMTTPGIVIGTPAYMPPEQGLGTPATPSFDVYALGAVLFEMLCGVAPFEGDDPLAVIVAKAGRPAPSIATKRGGVPPGVVELVAACLEVTPEARPVDMLDVRTRLDALLQVRTPAPKARRSPRYSRIATLGALVGALSWTAVTVASTPPAAAEDEGAEAATIEREVAREFFVVPSERSPQVRATPAIVPPPRARPRAKAPTATPRTPWLDTRECERMRTRALEARDAHDWTGVLRNVRDTACWGPMLERERLRVKAMLELERFAECVELGEDSRDSHVLKSVDLCRRRL